MSSVLFVAIPLLAAFLSILSKKIAPYLLLLVSALLIVLLGFGIVPLETVVIGGFDAPYGITLVFDNYSSVGLLVVNILFFLVTAISIKRFQKVASILLVALAGLNGVLLTGDLFNLFVFIEVSSIAAYLITTTNNQPRSTFHYLVIGTVGSSLYLFGLIILYAMFGTVNMLDLSNAIASSDASAVQVALPFLLMFIGLGVESKLFPFNSWVKGVLGSSNTLSGPMIASVYATAFALVFGRVLTEVFVISDSLLLIITSIIVISMLAGEAMAYASTKMREVLLYSSIAQSAFVILLFVLGFTEYGLLLAAINGFSKLVLYVITNTITEQTGTDEINTLKGIFTNNKLVGVSFSISTLSILGLPLFVGFIVKMNILIQMFENNHLLFPVVILISSVVEGVYFIKMLVKLWNKDAESEEVRFNTLTTCIVVVIAIATVIFGMWFEPLNELVNFTVGGIL